MRCLVTGGAGFIGSHLISALAKQGHTIRVLDNLITGNLSNLTEHRDSIEFIEGSILDARLLESAVAQVDVVFHQAAIPSVPRSIRDPLENHLNGAHATMLLLDAARRAEVKRVVVAGSASAYGEDEVQPKREAMAPQPLSPYAASKLAGEFYATVFARCYGLDTVIVRYFNVYGPRQDPSSPYSGVIAKFCEAFHAGRDVVIFGDGAQTRDFVFVSDVVNANVLAGFFPGRLNGRVFNIGCGQPVSLLELVDLLGEVSGKRLNPKHEPARAGDIRHSVADISLARKELRYAPRVSLLEGLRQTYAWYGQTNRQR